MLSSNAVTDPPRANLTWEKGARKKATSRAPTATENALLLDNFLTLELDLRLRPINIAVAPRIESEGHASLVVVRGCFIVVPPKRHHLYIVLRHGLYTGDLPPNEGVNY